MRVISISASYATSIEGTRSVWRKRMAKKDKKNEPTKLELSILHVAVEHLAAAAIPEMGIAMLELEELMKIDSDDPRLSRLYDALKATANELSGTIKEVIETIPGVELPSAEEIKAMLKEQQDEAAFVELLK